jgi:hypothetical protein
MGDQPVARLLFTHRTRQTQDNHTQTAMSRTAFELTTLALERPKTVHALCYGDTDRQFCFLIPSKIARQETSTTNLNIVKCGS